MGCGKIKVMIKYRAHERFKHYHDSNVMQRENIPQLNYFKNKEEKNCTQSQKTQSITVCNKTRKEDKRNAQIRNKKKTCLRRFFLHTSLNNTKI